MTVDRNRMAELHEEFLAGLFGGRKTKNSGATWKDPGDGRNNHLTEEWAFAWDGKSTRGKGIDLTRAIIEKIRDEAGGERPAVGLRFYGTDDLRQVDEDWVAVPAADFGELLAAARQVAGAQDAMRRVAEADELLAAGRAAAGLQRFEPPPPPSAMHGAYPPGLPVPPHELWPCLVVDSRHDPDREGRLVSRGYTIGDSGIVTEEGEIRSVRLERGVGEADRLFANDVIVRRGMWFCDGVLRATVGGPQR